MVRTEGEIDARSRMVHVVARVERPYERAGSPERAPLAVGLFVHAEIDGATATDVLEVPRSALRDGSKLLVVDASNRLYLRAVETVRLERNRALVRAVLAPGDRICVSPLEVVVNGMPVVAVEIDADAALGRGASS